MLCNIAIVYFRFITVCLCFRVELCLIEYYFVLLYNIIVLYTIKGSFLFFAPIQIFNETL